LGLLTVSVLLAGSDRDLYKAFIERGFVALEADSHGPGYSRLPLDTLRGKLEEVRHQPLPLSFARPLSLRPRKVASEEGGMPQAFVTVPDTRQVWPGIRSYVAGKTSSHGSQTFGRALLWRRQARLRKLELFVEQELGKPLGEVSEEEFAPLRDNPTFSWIVNDVFEEMTIFLSDRGSFGSGPAAGPLPTLRLIPSDQLSGADLKDFEGYRTDASGRFLVRRGDSVLILEDQKPYSIQESLDEDTLGDVLGHEVFHGIMSDLMAAGSAVGQSSSIVPHRVHAVTDRKMAFAEGFAEVFEGFFGEDRADLFKNGAEGSAARMFLGRQEALRRNRYVQLGYRKYHHTRPTGELENGARMVASEGVVAGLLYKILRHRQMKDPGELVFRALYLEAPQDLMGFLKALANQAPSEKLRQTILRTFLRESRFATVSYEAWRLYQVARKATLAKKRAANKKLPEVGDLTEAARSAQATFQALAKDLEAQVLRGELPIDAALGPELWLDGYTFTGERENRSPKAVFRYDLNATGPNQLANMGLSPKGAEAVLHHRAAQGFVSEIQELKRYLSEKDFLQLQEWRKSFDKNLAGQSAAYMEVLR
jgi:hypothetical protein